MASDADMIDEEKLLSTDNVAEGDMVAVSFESDKEEEEEETEEIKVKEESLEMDTNAAEKKEETEDKKDGEGKSETEVEKTLLTEMVRGPIRLSLVLIRDLSNHDLQQILHRCSKATLEMERRRGVMTLWFEPRRSIGSLAILRKLAQLKLAGEEFKMECPKALASMLASEKIKLKYPDGKYGNKNKTLYVHNIPKETTEEVLRGMFPDAASVQLPVDSEGEKLGIAILDFKSGKDANAALEHSPQVLVGESTCDVSAYFPAPEEAEDQQKKSGSGGGQSRKKDNWNKKRNDNYGRDRDRNRGYGGRNYGGYKSFGQQQERTNQMLMNQMQNLATMVMGNQGRYGGNQMGFSGDMGYGGDMGMGGGGFGNYQSGYFEDDNYGTPNKRRRGNMGGGNRGGGSEECFKCGSKGHYARECEIWQRLEKRK